MINDNLGNNQREREKENEDTGNVFRRGKKKNPWKCSGKKMFVMIINDDDNGQTNTGKKNTLI